MSLAKRNVKSNDASNPNAHMQTLTAKRYQIPPPRPPLGSVFLFLFLFSSLSQLIIIVVICYHRQEKKLNKKREKGKFNQIE